MRRLSLWSIVLLPCIILHGGVQDALLAQSASSGETVIPFTLTEHNNIVLRVVINETDSLQLMLHTAARDVTITEDGARKARSIKFTDSTNVKAWGGEAVSRFSKCNRVQLGSLQISDINIWENKLSGKGTDGKFGLDLFARRIVEIDFDRSQIVLHEKLPAKVVKYERLKIDNQDGQLLINGNCVVEGKTHANRFLLHTGYSGGILLDDAFVARTGVDGKIKITEQSSLKDSFGNTILVKKGVLPSFALGGSQLNNVSVGFFAGGMGSQKMSVIGSEVIKRFNLIFDLAKNDLYIALRDGKSR